MSDYGFSEIECKVILAQIERRAKCRMEYLRAKSDPCKHATEAGYVFDEAHQRFISMKTCQYDVFRASPRTAIKAVCLLSPMVIYGFCIWNQRRKFDRSCRCGILKYRDRIHKFA